MNEILDSKAVVPTFFKLNVAVYVEPGNNKSISNASAPLSVRFTFVLSA